MTMSNAMMEEVIEQSELLARLWETEAEWTAPFVELCREHDFKRLLFVGNGSPYYAGITLRHAAERMLRVNAESIPAAVFHNHGSFDASGSIDPSEILLVCPAETGHSKGQVDAARQARELGIPVVCTTLNPTGVLARECDVVLAKPGGTERSVAATKNQTMALFLVLCCFVEAGHALGNLSDDEYARLREALAAVPANVAESVRLSQEWFDANVERLLAAPAFFLIGYGANYGTVQEGALKFYETHERPTYAFELEETLHGPFRALHADDVALFMSAEPGDERDRMARLVDASARYCNNLVTVQSDLQKPAGDALRIASGDVEFVCAIEYLVPLQVIAALLSARIGIDTSKTKVSELDPVMLPAYED